MKPETEKKIAAAIDGWAYRLNLPATWHGFALNREPHVHDDVMEIFRYENVATHRYIVAYFHEETMEYKLKVGYGLIEFCRIECIAAELAAFEQLLAERLDGIIGEMAAEKAVNLSSFVIEKKITEYDFGDALPECLDGFELFIRPTAPIPITNFSYVIIDYECFELESSFTIYYNVFRDEFFGEARICRIPAMNYLFDSTGLDELAEKLRVHLAPRLAEIKDMAKKSAPL